MVQHLLRDLRAFTSRLSSLGKEQESSGKNQKNRDCNAIDGSHNASLFRWKSAEWISGKDKSVVTAERSG